jgi:hypothetical protein
MKKVLPPALSHGRQDINEQLVESLCQSIGFNHQPYSWLETTCDVMVDEYQGENF